MKIMFYALRPFDEQAYCEPYSKQYGIDYAYTAEVPTPDNLELAKGCDAVSTNPCLIAPEYLEACPAAALAMTISRSRKPRSLACASPIPGIRRQVWPIMPLC
jgi:hypothetical protein